MPKEAQARIKINKLLEEAGWRFFDSSEGKANIVLEASVKITKRNLSDLGDDFDKTKTGFIDFLLLDEKGFPFIVLEAKAENKNPLSGKEQARQYAQSHNIADLSFCPTETAIISGIWNGEIHRLSIVSLRRN